MNQSSFYYQVPPKEIEEFNPSKFSEEWQAFLRSNSEKQHLAKFINQQEDFLFLSFNNEKSLASSDIEPCLNKCSDHVFNILLDILQWLSKFKALDAKLKIQMSFIGETIEIPLMYQIQSTMSLMKNFSVIDIQELYCDMKNEYTFSLFSSFAISDSYSQRYTYTLRNTQTNETIKYEKYSSGTEQLCNWILDSKISKQTNFQDFPLYLSKVHYITSQLLNYRENMQSSIKLQNQSNQFNTCINFAIYAPNTTFQEQLVILISFLKVQDLEFDNISRIRVFIEMSSEGKSFMPNENISEILEYQNGEFFTQRLLEKCTLSCPQRCEIGLNLFLVLLSRIKVLTCRLNAFSNTPGHEDLLLAEINRSNEKGKPFLIERLRMKGVFENHANRFIQVVPLLHKLKELSIHTEVSYPPNIFLISNCLKLVGQIDSFEIPKLIRFEKQKLLIYVDQFKENFEQEDYRLMKAIESLDRPIHLSWIYSQLFINNASEIKWVFDFMRLISNFQNVIFLRISRNRNIIQIYEITQERLRYFYSITAFRNIIQPEMLFSPAAILSDLYAFD